jgi:hypothetical protein
LLRRAGIDTVVLEHRRRGYCEKRVLVGGGDADAGGELRGYRVKLRRRTLIPDPSLPEGNNKKPFPL